MNKLLFILSTTLFLAIPAIASSPDSGRLTLLIHPFLANEQILKRFTPFADYLSEKLNKQVNIKISNTYKTHIDNIGNNEFDIAYIGPYSYVTMSQKYGKKPLLGRLEIKGKPTFQGKIVTRIDSSIKHISDLKEKRFAFGDKNSTMSYIVPKYVLIKNGIPLTRLKSFKHYQSHSAVIDAVLSKTADAGAVKEEIYYKNMDFLKAIASTPKISEHLFLGNKDIPKHLISKIKRVMLSMNKDINGLKAMRSIKTLMTGIVTVKHEDYNNLLTIYSKTNNQP